MQGIDSDVVPKSVVGVVPDIPAEWKSLIGDELEQPYFKALLTELQERSARGAVIYPDRDHVFNALQSTSPNQVRLVILGQDPYHGPGQAHGLAFSVNRGVIVPPSLKNMYKELASDVQFQKPDHGCLQEWAAQGVLLLNSVLTVEKAQAGSHRGLGWEQFTDAMIRAISEHCAPVVFLLWGGYAQKKAKLIEHKKHLVLMAPHPSPLSVYRGFYGCHHFSQANAFLRAQGREPVDWQLSLS